MFKAQYTTHFLLVFVLELKKKDLKENDMHIYLNANVLNKIKIILKGVKEKIEREKCIHTHTHTL